MDEKKNPREQERQAERDFYRLQGQSFPALCADVVLGRAYLSMPERGRRPGWEEQEDGRS
ncbi:MAG: hypothetical protein IKS29_04530 [Oscillospiraceae bacterium]|nr:hypothetical protein [Oscillospiraceae bacterium]